MIAFIALSIVLGVALLRREGIDTRSLDAEILATRVENCVVQENIFLESNAKNISKCGIDPGSLGERSILIYKNNELVKSEGKEIIYGRDFRKECELKISGITAKEYPACSQKEVTLFSPDNKETKIRIIAGTQEGR